MSGPKVVRIVTREELLARAEAQLRRLEIVAEEWTRALGSTQADKAALAALNSRRQEFTRLLNENRFADLRRQVAADISFLEHDHLSRRENAAAAAAAAVHNQRRVLETARFLLQSLDKAGTAVPPQLRQDLNSAATAEGAISKAFALMLPSSPSNQLSERQRQIAEDLGQDETRMTLVEWLSKEGRQDRSPKFLEIEKSTAELERNGRDPSPFNARASAIEREETSRQALLLDSLLVDLSTAVKKSRNDMALLSALRQRTSELKPYSSGAAISLRQQLDAAVSNKNFEKAPSLISQADALLEEEIDAIAAASRRRAILQGLAKLGYGVNEGMATAWVEKGQIVLRSPSHPGYGVELGGGLKSKQIQLRTVSLSSANVAPNINRDRETEAAWCSDVERLHDLISAAGGEFEIASALPVGAIPLKVVSDHEALDEVEEAPNMRSLGS